MKEVNEEEANKELEKRYGKAEVLINNDDKMEKFLRKLEKKLKDAALIVSNSLDLDTYAKVDFILRKDNTFVCLECDSQPRLNSDSQIILSAQNANLSFTDFCKKVLELSYFNK